MVDWSAPGALAALVLLPPLWWWLRRRPRGRAVPVAALYLWRQSPAARHHPDPGPRPWRPVAILALLLLALAGPRWPVATADDPILPSTSDLQLERLALRPGLENDGWQGLAVVGHAGQEVAGGRLTVTADGRTLIDRDLSLAPGGQESLTFVAPAAASRVTARLNTGQTLELAVDHPPRWSVAVDPACPEAVTLALTAHPALVVTVEGELSVGCSLDPPAADQALWLRPVTGQAPLAEAPTGPLADRLTVAVPAADLGPGGESLLGDGERVLARRLAPRVETALDWQWPAFQNRADYPLLLTALVEAALDRPLDAIYSVERSRPPPTPPAPASRTLDLAWPLMMAAVLLLTLEAVADRRYGLLVLVPLLALAIWNPPWLPARGPVHLLLLWDTSPSAAPLQSLWPKLRQRLADLPGGSRITLLPFAAGVGPVMQGMEPGRLPQTPPRAEGHATRTAQALATALTLRHGTLADTLLLVGDGRDTGGGLPQSLGEVRDAGLEVLGLFPPLPGPDARIDRLTLPPRARPGGDWPVTVALSADRPLTGNLDLLLDGAVVARTIVQLDPGGKTLTRRLTTGPGLHRIEARLRVEGDQVPANDTASARLEVPGPGRLVWVGLDAVSPWPAGLAAQGWRVEISTPEGLARQSQRLDGTDLLVLDDLAVSDLPDATWRDLTRRVEGGLGLLVTGGTRGFWADYRHSPLETLLPVTLEGQAGPGAAVAFLVDQSGSMGELGGQGLARLVLERAGTLLGPGDRAGLWTFDRESHLQLPLAARPRPGEALAGALPREPGGGTRLAPALARVLAALADEPADERLLVLVSDGFLEEDLTPVGRQLMDSRVTLVVVAVGRADTAPLTRLTDRVLTVTGNRAQLPRRLEQVLQRRLHPRVTGPRSVLEVTPLAGLGPRDWPQVEDYPLTRLRPGASLHLASDRNDPLLAVQNFGAGRVAALPAGLAPWTGWASGPAALAALAGELAGRDDPRLYLEVTPGAGQLTVTLERLDPTGEWAEPAPARLWLTEPGEKGTLELPPLAPGRQGAVVTVSPGDYGLTVAVGQSRVRAWPVVEPRAEWPPPAPWTDLGVRTVTDPADLPDLATATRTGLRSPLLVLVILAWAGWLLKDRLPFITGGRRRKP